MPGVHFIAPEYPPSVGGVADYTRQIAMGLARAGDEVHVWCPGRTGETNEDGVRVHRDLGDFSAADLRAAGTALDLMPAPRRLIVQWVPHGFGRRAMNVPFCLWLARRARYGDTVELMVHEPFVAFGEGGWRQAVVACVHRLMAIVLLRRAARVWVSIPAWQPRFEPYALGRRIPFTWLPVPSPLVSPPLEAVDAARRRLGAPRLVGHLSTYGRLVTDLLDEVLPAVLGQCRAAQIVLIGEGSEAYAADIRRRLPQFASRVGATGRLEGGDLSAAIAACDVLLQPYPDGVSSRRTTTMAGLALGVPVVTTRGHLTERLWEESRIVRLASVGDTRTMAAHVCEMLGAPEERRRQAENAREYYRARFDVQHTIAALRAA